MDNGTTQEKLRGGKPSDFKLGLGRIHPRHALGQARTASDHVACS